MADYKKSEQREMPGIRRFGGHQNRFMPSSKPKNSRSTLIRLLKIYMKWSVPLILVVIFTVFLVAAGLAVPFFIGKALNAFPSGGGSVEQKALTTILISLVICYAVSWLSETFNGYIMASVSQKLVKYIRAEFFAKLKKLPLNFYDTRSNGDTMSRLTNDVDIISSTIAQTTTQLIQSVLSVSGALVMMLVLSPLLTLAAVITLPAVFVLTNSVAGRSRKYFTAQQRALGTLNGITEENIHGIKLIKAYNRQDAVMEKFAAINGELCNYSTKAQIWSGFLMPLMNVINNLSYALVATAGGVMSAYNMVSVGVVVSFSFYARHFVMPLNNIAGMFNVIQSALAGAERIFEIMDENEEIEDKDDAVALDGVNGEVEFKNVYFSYVDGAPVLKNISFLVKAGSTVAFVGETGVGKTTIVNLITRFYDVSKGEIRIDGVNITDIKRESLRNCFSVVLQDTCLFSGTIADNIRYSNPTASDKEVINAAKLARAHEFISLLPKKYDTVVSGNTDNLSIGQKQLIAIARAILSDARILILDEATSSVDTKTEKDIQKAMLRLRENKTSFLIAHRLSTIRDTDKIIVIGNGEITESGTHEQLMRNKKKYYQMVMSQTSPN